MKMLIVKIWVLCSSIMVDLLKKQVNLVYLSLIFIRSKVFKWFPWDSYDKWLHKLFYELQFVDKEKKESNSESNEPKCILRGEDSITFLLLLMMSLQCVGIFQTHLLNGNTFVSFHFPFFLYCKILNEQYTDFLRTNYNKITIQYTLCRSY